MFFFFLSLFKSSKCSKHYSVWKSEGKSFRVSQTHLHSGLLTVKLNSRPSRCPWSLVPVWSIYFHGWAESDLTDSWKCAHHNWCRCGSLIYFAIPAKGVWFQLLVRMLLLYSITEHSCLPIWHALSYNLNRKCRPGYILCLSWVDLPVGDLYSMNMTVLMFELE